MSRAKRILAEAVTDLAVRLTLEGDALTLSEACRFLGFNESSIAARSAEDQRFADRVAAAMEAATVRKRGRIGNGKGRKRGERRGK